MDLLARREHSARELRNKLLLRGFEREEAEQAIEGLAADGLVSDERFAEAFVASRGRKGQGPVRIRGELEQRGVADDLIAASIGRVEVDWTVAAFDVRRKKYGLGAPRDIRERARQSKFLQYRGFTGEQVRRALDMDNEPD